jgi:DNA-binding NarL/FixJ family response regulator
VIGQAATEGAAIQGVAALRPEVIIIDIRLHEGNGVNVLRSISRMRESFAPTLIMLTNYAIPEYEKECLAMGAHYFFDKATEFDRVSDVLEELACGRGS